MSVNEKMVQDVVKEVMAKLQLAAGASEGKGIFADMNDAIAAAKKAQRYIHRMSMDQREQIISNIRANISAFSFVFLRMLEDRKSVV